VRVCADALWVMLDGSVILQFLQRCTDFFYRGCCTMTPSACLFKEVLHRPSKTCWFNV